MPETATIPANHGAADAVYGRISRKRKVLADITSVKSRRTRLTYDRDLAVRNLREARQRVESFKSEKSASLREEAQADAEYLETAIADTEAQLESLTEELTRLETVDLPACDGDTGIDAVLDHQQRMEDARSTISSLEGLIADHRKAAENAVASIPSLEDLHRRREDLLAEISVGGATSEDLESLDREIGEAVEEAERVSERADAVADSASQAMAGLERKLTEARKRLSNLEGHTPELMQMLLRSEAERACADYVSAALKLRETFLQVCALDKMAKDLGEASSPFLMTKWWETFIPVFSLPGCDPHRVKGYDGEMFSAGRPNFHQVLAAAAESERERLGDLGVEGL